MSRLLCRGPRSVPGADLRRPKPLCLPKRCRSEEVRFTLGGGAGMRSRAHDTEVPVEDARHHEHVALRSKQCCSAVVQHVAAPPAAVWSVVRRFRVARISWDSLPAPRVIRGGIMARREVEEAGARAAGPSSVATAVIQAMAVAMETARVSDKDEAKPPCCQTPRR
ncbi:hypothetical protein BS78_05G110300 [Paspalum vaginatum]|nr:hypothetical protein BS78_05G110300 [Paspalum vaginatum]